jgi:hypothetical protein
VSAPANIEETLRQLEERLLTSAVRHNEQEVSSLLADEFQEYGSSGRVYSKAEIVRALQNESSRQLSLHCFEGRGLAEGVVHVTYRALSEFSGTPPVASLRSSIWVFRDGRWQMLFHQGTRIPD